MSARPVRSRSNACPDCGSSDLLRLELSVGDEPVSFTSCHGCERRWWERSGATLPLQAVLHAVSPR